MDLHLRDAFPHLSGCPLFWQHELYVGIIHPTDFVIEPKNISLGSPFSDLPLDDFGIWFSLFLVCSCFIIPNYCYYSELDYIIDQDTGKRTGDGKEEDLNERTYKVTILEKK